MERYEFESLLKNFFIFFFLQLMLLGIIYFQTVSFQIQKLDNEILSKMKICSFDLKCKDFEIDFVSKGKSEIAKLYKHNDIYALFHIPTSNEYFLKIVFKKDKYAKQTSELKNLLLKKFLLYAVFIGVLSFLFSLYSLNPLKKALKLNESFIKDILHDFNTPISSLVINFKLFKKEIGDNKKIKRMEKNIDTILSLQDNLKAFLQNSKLQTQTFNLKEVIKNRVNYFKELYPNIRFFINLNDCKINSNKDTVIRISDNLLSNSCKYNKKDGFIKVSLRNGSLTIEDSGIGIKDTKKVFDRFYKENNQGIGIGLHIVKKLCDELKIKIKISSKIDVGTKILLDFHKVIVK